jgi:fructokinase
LKQVKFGGVCVKVWSIGEMLWDVFPDQERFGGAALNFCANLQRMGNTATLVSAVGRDPRGELALARMRTLGLSTRFISVIDDLPTGVAMITRSASGEPSYAIPRPAAFDRIATGPEILEQAEESAIDWLYFGTLLQTEPVVERFTTELVRRLPEARCFYDMNLRTGHWNLALVERLSQLATVLKLNETEAETLHGLTRTGTASYSLETFCRAWSKKYSIATICVTLGSAGCYVYDRGAGLTVRGFPVTVCDTVGSGDAFAAAFLHGYQQRWATRETARFANALGAIVASRAGATPEWAIDECLALAHSA